MNSRRLVLFALLLLALIGAALTMSENLFSPYVSFKKAISIPNQYVQIIGVLDKKFPVKYNEKSYVFSIVDEDKTTLTVEHTGTKPSNFEHADKVVALGKYNPEGKIFLADKILVKCPSKYTKGK